eukprot:IDg9933t1
MTAVNVISSFARSDVWPLGPISEAAAQRQMVIGVDAHVTWSGYINSEKGVTLKSETSIRLCREKSNQDALKRLANQNEADRCTLRAARRQSEQHLEFGRLMISSLRNYGALASMNAINFLRKRFQ